MEERPIHEITSVRVAGVDPALARTLSSQLATKVGTLVSEAPLRDDVRRLWKSGVVADARVELEGHDRTGVVFLVEPRDVIDRVTIRGGDREMARRFRLLSGAPYEPARLQRMAESAQLTFIRSGHVDANVEIKRAATPHGVAVCVAANPGPKLTIAEIEFPGASLPKTALLAEMKGSKKTNRVGGVFDAGGFEIDKIYLEAAYWERGHADVRVGEPRAIRRGTRLIVEIPIDEGPVFRFGRVTASHRLDRPVALDGMFARSKIVDLLERLRALPGVDDVTPRTNIDRERHTIDVAFDIQWRWPWHVLSHWRLPSSS